MSIVEFDITQEELMIGSWLEISVRIDPKSGLKFDDIEFALPQGKRAGVVSTARDGKFDPLHPKIMLCAGYKPGKYELLAVDKVKKMTLGEMIFVVGPVMGNGENGPSLWFEGIVEGFVRGATWGGGSNEPENMNISPNFGEWPVAILLVDTADFRYPDDQTTIQGFKDTWKQQAFSLDPLESVRSVAKYYREVSYFDKCPDTALTITGEVFGPAHLPGNWSDYFNLRIYKDKKTGKEVSYDIWDPNGNLAQACFTAGDDLIDFSKFKSLVMVMPPTKENGVWPQAWGHVAKTSKGDISYSLVVMPNEIIIPPSNGYETLAHELGHNFGLTDLYKPRYPPNSTEDNMQNLGYWDLMHWQGGLPQMCVMSRMAEGWIKKDWIKTFNFASQQPTPPVNQQVTLNPLEDCPPPSDRYSAIEIRLAPGRNYYVEYRAPLSHEISDKQLPSPNKILITDASLPSPNETVPYDRPRVMFVNRDSDGDGPILGEGQDFRDTDISSLAHDPFKILVNSIDSTNAVVTIQYGPVGKPDPYIRPWPASPDREWQSPDIEVRNARSEAFPQWWNMPWEGNENTVIAKVTNGGTLDAPGVVVNFYVQPYDAAGYPIGAQSLIGSDSRDIPAGQSVEFSTMWIPPDQGHRCISVDIPQYSAPGTPPVQELTDRNNFAQSNYTKYISSSASPFTRETMFVGVYNPFSYRTGIFIIPRQTHPNYRTYIESTYVTLDPSERREIKIMVEYMGLEKSAVDELFLQVNHIAIAAFIFCRDPYDPNKPSSSITDETTPQLLGGVDIDIAAARATRFAFIKYYGEGKKWRVKGALVTIDDGEPIPDGKILLIDSPTKFPSRWPKRYRQIKIKNGEFDAIAPAGRVLVAYYGGIPGYGECLSDTLRIPR